jgi:anti-sigma factor RsiW
MSCDYNEKVSLLIDGELPATEARLVEHHLTECVECQMLRADFLSVRSQIGDYAPALAPAARRHALAKILSRQGVTTGRSRRSIRDLAWGFNPSWVAAAAGLIIVAALITLVLYRNSHLGVVPQQVKVDQSPATVPTPIVDQPKSPTPANSPAELVVNQQKAATPQQRVGSVKRNVNISPSNSQRIAAATPLVPNEVVPVDLGTQTNAEIADVARVRSVDAETMTATHLEKSELLLRAFRNLRLAERGVSAEVGYERNRAQQLVYQNIILRREADSAGDVEVATLLGSLEPILLDIANLPEHPQDEDIHAIQKRVERKNIVALLQVNSTALARALD